VPAIVWKSSDAIHQLEKISTPEGCQECSQVWSAARHAWLANLAMTLHAEGVRANSFLAPFSGCAPSQNRTRGCARFTRFPWQHPQHAFGVLVPPLMRHDPAILCSFLGMPAQH
jgi:hypothetical protein